jgi:hypothetical protein
MAVCPRDPSQLNISTQISTTEVKMASSNTHPPSHEHGRPDALGINGAPTQARDGIAAQPTGKVNFVEPEQLPKPLRRRSTMKEIIRGTVSEKVNILLRRQVKIYVMRTGKDEEPVEARLKIENGNSTSCRISRTFLVDKGFDQMLGEAFDASAHHSVLQYIELKWAPRKNCTVTPLTKFSICEEVKGGDCVLSKDEFKKKATRSASWATFCKIRIQQDRA